MEQHVLQLLPRIMRKLDLPSSVRSGFPIVAVLNKLVGDVDRYLRPIMLLLNTHFLNLVGFKLLLLLDITPNAINGLVVIPSVDLIINF